MMVTSFIIPLNTGTSVKTKNGRFFTDLKGESFGRMIAGISI